MLNLTLTYNHRFDIESNSIIANIFDIQKIFFLLTILIAHVKLHIV